MSNDLNKWADAAWLKLLERIAVGLLCFLGWQIWSDVGDLKEATPLIEQRVKSLESQDQEFKNLSIQRMAQYDLLRTEISKLQIAISEVNGRGETLGEKLDALTKQVDRLVDQKFGSNK